MVFGYNTDVKAGDKVYHVQTEDRGEKSPVIDSVIYVKGRIIDRRCTPYVPGDHTPGQLQELAKSQHRTLVEAIRNGTYQAPVDAPAAVAKETRPRQAAPAATQAPGPNWDQLLDSGASRKVQTCSLELMDSSDVESDQELVFRLKVSDPGSGHPVAGAAVRALLREEDGGETVREAKSSDEGVAEIRFDAPREGKATVLFQATRPATSGLLRFHVRRAAEPHP